jgi:hypothetical protein
VREHLPDAVCIASCMGLHAHVSHNRTLCQNKPKVASIATYDMVTMVCMRCEHTSPRRLQLHIALPGCLEPSLADLPLNACSYQAARGSDPSLR